MIWPLYRGCPLLRGSNCIILIGRDKFGDLVLSIVETYLIQCPFLGGSSLRGSTVVIKQNFFTNTNMKKRKILWFGMIPIMLAHYETEYWPNVLETSLKK